MQLVYASTVDQIEISNVKELQGIQDDPSANYVLINDIDASETKETFGDGFRPIYGFSGSFDGQGHVIENLYINRPKEDSVGLFATIEDDGNVKNVGVTDANIVGSRYVGGLAGVSWGSVKNSYVTGEISGDIHVGGLVGYQRYGTVSNSYSKADVTGANEVGGLVGTNAVGTGEIRSLVSKSYSTGYVEEGKSMIGGLIGVNYDVVSKSFWDIKKSGMENSDGGTGLTTEEMKTRKNFTDASWDFDKTWSIDENEKINDGYPFLQNLVPEEPITENTTDENAPENTANENVPVVEDTDSSEEDGLPRIWFGIGMVLAIAILIGIIFKIRM